MTITISVPLFIAFVWVFGGLLFSYVFVGWSERHDAVPDSVFLSRVLLVIVALLSGPLMWITMLHRTPDRELKTIDLISNRVALYRGTRDGARTKGPWFMPVWACEGLLRIGTRRTGMIIRLPGAPAPAVTAD